MRTSAKGLAACVAVAVFFTAGIAEAQRLSYGYGQDETPGSSKGFANWGAYGVDLVPAMGLYHSGHYVLAYGVDPVPGTPRIDRLREVLPGQMDEVLTGDIQSASPRDSYVTAPRRRWRMR